MRIPVIAPADLTPDQKPLYEDMRAGIAQNFKGFTVYLIGVYCLVSVTLNGFDVPVPEA